MISITIFLNCHGNKNGGKTAHISDMHGSKKYEAAIHNPSLKKHKEIVAAAVMDSYSSKDEYAKS